jgi:dipeptidyl aminopeptidase/acylaminoacyl peptidase
MPRAFIVAIAALAVLVPHMEAQKPEAQKTDKQNRSAKTAGLPPLIDRELLFGDPEISGAQLSPNGEYLAFMKPWKETRNVWVKRTGEPFSEARLMTTETARPVGGYLWTRDSKYVVFVKDNAGDENFNVFAVDPAAAPVPGADAPPSRDLTNLKGVRVNLFSAPKSDPDVIYIGLNDRDPSWHDLYKLKLSTGERTLIRKNTDHIAAWIFDLKGNLRLAQRVLDNGDQEILRVDANSFTPIYTCNVFESCDPIQFHNDGQRVYIQTNKGDLDLTTLALLDPATGKLDTVESDPLKRVDLGTAWFSEATDELVATEYSDDRDRLYFRDKAFEADYQWLEKKLPGREISLVSSSRDDRQWLISAHGDVEPGEVYLFSRDHHTLALQYKVRDKLPRESLSPMQAVHYPSSDGLDIPAYLTLPKGLEPKGLPTLLVPHGGPWARDGWGYNTLAQFFANRGYAVLMPNFRGSTGYGKKFLNAGNGEWGTKMQDDLTWGVKYLVAQGIADSKRIGILGGSYGGYATLAGVAFTPDVYRAAVDIVGPSNLITLLSAIPPYWEAGRKIMYARMADPETPAGKKWLEEQSPLHSAAKIKTPLMVVQGANDPRVNRREAEQIVIALRDRGFPVEYLLAPDEGHGFARPVNNLAMFMAVEKFLAAHLDGRYQEGGSAESVERLKEITVDPKTVVISKKLDASKIGVPKVTADLKPGVYHYDAKVAMGTQQMALKLSTTIQDAGGSWTAIENIETPTGAMLDTATLEKGSLTLQKRTVKQGPMTIDVAFADGKATGSVNMSGGDAKPVAAELDGPLFADSAGAASVIGCLPLAEGYKTAFRNFDVQKQKVKLMQLEVAGSQNVTVPAGTFDTFKVELLSADGGPDKSTVWIAKESRIPVKLSALMPDMGGATLTAELLP